VIAPVINSLTMILLAIVVIYRGTLHEDFSVRRMEWFLLIAGSVITIAAYTQPYFQYITQRFTLREFLQFNSGKELTEYAMKFIPQQFNWLLFTMAELMFLLAISRIWFRKKPL
jgi:multisubunit Na+/H+ antiporter MnhB subunit